nr:MAG TPA: hypothetical protein [Bacteriophage sp.]
MCYFSYKVISIIKKSNLRLFTPFLRGVFLCVNFDFLC